jgi:hypothetical protein
MISFSFIIIILIAWTGFTLFSSEITEDCTFYASTLATQTIPSGNWTYAEKQFDTLCKQWHRYKKIAYYFLDAKEINDIDGTLQKAHLYMQAHDISNASGEMVYLKNRIHNLHQNDTIMIRNIF